MRIWLLKIGELVHSDGPDVRLFRTGTFANLLAAQGHEVVWWSATFDHQRKRHRFMQDSVVDVGPRLRLRLLHSPGYRRHLSIQRLLDHQIVARRFRATLHEEPRPDLIVCSFPTIELAAASVRYGLACGVPVVLDVRDLWPDTFVEAAPRGLRWLARLLLRRYYAETRFALANATGLVAMSDGVLRWALGHAGRQRSPCDRVFPLGYTRPSSTPEGQRAAAESLHALGVDPGKWICWFIGMFGKMYDVATVIAAARELAARGVSDIQFVISGDGERRAEWERGAAGLGNVIFTGWIDVQQIAYLMGVARAGLVAVDALPGTLPNKLFEYFSAGIPVLSSAVGEAEDLVRDTETGLSYRARDPAGLVQAIEQLHNDEQARQRLGANARHQYETRFTAERVYGDMAEFVTSMARSTGPGVTAIQR